MAKIKQLEKYTAASLAVANFKAKHAKIFAEFDALLLHAGEAEAELKDYVKSDIKGNIANEFVRVTYSPSFKKGYDAKIVLKLATPKERKALEAAGALVVKEEIVPDTFEELVEKGEVSVAIKQKSFVETELAPRVSIKEIK